MRATFRTRPFQAFFLAASDMLELALPYYRQIQDSGKEYELHGNPGPLASGVWRKDKSLSIASFMTKYAGLEALVNCAHDEFIQRELAEIPKGFFPPQYVGLLTKLSKKSFVEWGLKYRVLLLPSLCCNPVVNPFEIFDVNTVEWKLFLEVIEIRHSFSHPSTFSKVSVLKRVRPGFLEENDEVPSNFWPLSNAPREHRIFSYADAVKMNSAIDSIVTKLRNVMPYLLNETFMYQESLHIG